jgi:hypothetical protein
MVPLGCLSTIDGDIIPSDSTAGRAEEMNQVCVRSVHIVVKQSSRNEEKNEGKSIPII